MNMNFIVNKPLKGHDEDAPPYADPSMLVVCDGLGGGGQNTYIVDGEKRTSAYLGSRQISKAFTDFMKDHADQIWESLDHPSPIIEQLHQFIQKRLTEYVEEKGLKNLVRGRSMQMLPATLAAVLYRSTEDHTDAFVISAGDSRVYMLTPEQGLQQLSKDDVDGEFDAYEKSASMSNNISQDRDYYINYRYFKLPSECILFACSDGCFDYISSPIELEFYMDFSIVKSSDVLDPDKNSIGEYFGDILVRKGLQDDCTVAGAVIGYENEEEFKQRFLARAQFIKNNYRDPWMKMDQAEMEWKRSLEPELNECSKNVKTLSAKLFAKLEEYIVEAWKSEKNPAVEIDPRMSELVYSLREFPLYRNYVDSENAKLAKATESIRKYEDEYDAIMNQMKKLFKEKMFEEYIEDLEKTGFLRRTNFHMSYQEKQYRDVCRRKTVEEKQLVYFHKCMVGKYHYVFHISSNNFPEDIRTREFVDLCGNIFHSFNNYDSILKNRNLFREELREDYLRKEDIEEKFNSAIENHWSKYIRKNGFSEINRLYQDSEALNREKQKIVIPTEEQQEENFRSFLKENLKAFIERIRNNPALFRSLCGEEADKLIHDMKRIKEIKDKIREPERMRHKLWMHYNFAYEYYKNGNGGMV